MSRYAKADYPSPVKDALTQTSLPAWVWMVEVTVSELFTHSMAKVGEILIDPEFNIAEFLKRDSGLNLEPVLFIHLPHFVWHPREMPDTAAVLFDDGPTPVYSRPAFGTV